MSLAILWVHAKFNYRPSAHKSQSYEKSRIVMCNVFMNKRSTVLFCDLFKKINEFMNINY